MSGKSVQDKWPESTGHGLVVGLLPGCRPALWPVGATSHHPTSATSPLRFRASPKQKYFNAHICLCDAIVMPWYGRSYPPLISTNQGSSSWSTFQYQKLRLQKWFHAACAFSNWNAYLWTLKSVKPQPEGLSEKSHHSLGYQRKGFFFWHCKLNLASLHI